MPHLNHKWVWLGFALCAVAFGLWSYALVDPNLVLSGWSPYWQAQQWLWEHIWKQKPLLTSLYLGIITLWFGTFIGLLTTLSQNTNSNTARKWLTLFALGVISVGIISQNALSHDLFNYAFNAKMVLQYHANPHVQTALDFPADSWTRFMHNTHTPAPYGYGWTALSLIPAKLGMSIFTLTLLLFKLFNLLAAIGLYYVLNHLSRQLYHRSLTLFQLALLFLNPLFLIEIFANGHNDLWMMLPALIAVSFLLKFKARKSIAILIWIVVFNYLSLEVKFATAVLAPIWLLFLGDAFFTRIIKRLGWANSKLMEMHQWCSDNWPLLGSMLMFLPLFTDRSQQFHPWYLVWVLVWLPLIKQVWWQKLVLVFCFSSLLRYLPWLLAGEFSPMILWQQKIITWGIPAIWLIMMVWYAKKTSR